MTEPAVVVQKAYDWVLWIIPKVEKFPRSYRFSIGQNLVAASIELLMNLVDATYQARNAGSLAAAVREVMLGLRSCLIRSGCLKTKPRLARKLQV